MTPLSLKENILHVLTQYNVKSSILSVFLAKVRKRIL